MIIVKIKKASRIVICEVKRIAEVNVAHANSKARHLKKVVTKSCRDIKSKAIEDIEEIRAQSQLCKKACRDLHSNDKKENRAAISKLERKAKATVGFAKRQAEVDVKQAQFEATKSMLSAIASENKLLLAEDKKKKALIKERHLISEKLAQKDKEIYKFKKDQAAQIANIHIKNRATQKLCQERNKNRVDDMNAIADRMSKQIHIEKKQRRECVSKEYSKRKVLETQLRELNTFTDEMADEVKVEQLQAKATIRKALKGKAKSDARAEGRLIVIRNLKNNLRDAQDILAIESHKRAELETTVMEQLQISASQQAALQIKRKMKIGRRGGSRTWPIDVVLVICEMLVNGTPPSAIPANIQTMSAGMYGSEVAELPSLNYVRQCRVILQGLNTTLAALRLANATEWSQLFTDGTSRRQIAFQDLVISVVEDNRLDPVIVSSCMYLEDESSDMQVKSIITEVSIQFCLLIYYYPMHIDSHNNILLIAA